MVVLTKRQSNILSVVMQKNHGVTIDELVNSIGVSRRTIYRDLSEIKPILKDKGVSFVKDGNIYYLKSESEDSLVELKKEFQILPDMDSTQRKNLLVIMLLLENDYQKITTFAYDLNVSKNTVINDLMDINKIFSEYSIELIREKSKGIRVKGQEEKRRELLCSMLMNSFNKYNFFEILKKDQITNDNSLFKILSFNLLKRCYKSIIDNFNTEPVSDLQLLQSIFMLYISVVRIKSDCFISEVHVSKIDIISQQKVQKILSTLIGKTAPIKEILYATQYFRYSSSKWDPLNVDSKEEADINRKIFEFVRRVSVQFHFNFEANNTFINGITKHIKNLVKDQRNQLPDLKIETLESIKNRFPKLFEIITSEWNRVFEIKITKTEVELILLYFASAYMNNSENDKTHNVSILIVCENGIGTSAILKKRLEKYFPSIRKIDVSKISQLDKKEIINHDVILSTLKLENFPKDYLQISPLLFPDEISKIREYVQRNIIDNDDIYNERPINESVREEELLKIDDAKNKFNYLVYVTETAKAIFDNFLNVNIAEDIATIETLIYYIINNLKTTIVENKLDVINALIYRKNLAPIAIPDTGIALLHASKNSIKMPCFRIYNLSSPIKMINMSYQPEEINRVILLLGNEDDSQIQSKLLGIVSSLLVMSSETLKIMKDGDEEEIKKLLASQLLNYLIKLTQRLK